MGTARPAEVLDEATGARVRGEYLRPDKLLLIGPGWLEAAHALQEMAEPGPRPRIVRWIVGGRVGGPRLVRDVRVTLGEGHATVEVITEPLATVGSLALKPRRGELWATDIQWPAGYVPPPPMPLPAAVRLFRARYEAGRWRGQKKANKALRRLRRAERRCA